MIHKISYYTVRNLLAGVAVSEWFIETTLAGWVLASSVFAQKQAGWVNNVDSTSRKDPVSLLNQKRYSQGKK